MTPLPDALNKASTTERGQAQDRAVAKLAGVTVAEYDTDTTAADPRPRRYAFNGATRLLNINEDRVEFHRWAGKMVHLSFAYSESTWRIYYEAFKFCESAHEHQIQDEDARDEYDTQQDALR